MRRLTAYYRLEMLPTTVRRLLLVMLALVMSLQPMNVIATDVDYQFYAANDILYYDPNSGVHCITTSGTTTVQGTDNIAKMWNYFIGKGLTDYQAAGILGNIEVESGFSPFRHQVGMAWPSGGYGIVQWDGSRREAVTSVISNTLGPETFRTYYSIEYGGATTKENGYVPSNVDVAINDQFLSVELDFLYQEATTRQVRAGYGSGTEWDSISAAKDVRAASDVWLYSFERPADQSDTHAAERAKRGDAILRDMQSRSPSAVQPAPDNEATPTPSDGPTTVESTISATNKGTILLDPGHGAAIPEYTDQATGLRMSETPNMPESDQMLEVARQIKSGLEALGYRVVLTRNDNTQQVTFRERADAAVTARATLGISLHSTPGSVNDAWGQRVGAYREYGGKRTEFTNQTTADKSQKYSEIIATARAKAEGRPVGTDPAGQTQTNSFNREGIASKGNIPLISLFSETIPWSYNEFALENSPAMTETQLKQYADGIIEGVSQIEPNGLPTAGGCPDGVNFSSGDLSAATLAYAWPDYAAGKTEPMPAYRDAVSKSREIGQYIGATADWCRANSSAVSYDGIDCGGFVTTLVINSGWDPRYNSNGRGGFTGLPDQPNTQWGWLEANWEELGDGDKIDSADLRPGDVAINAGHTFIFVGDIPGFNSKIASASLCDRAPMAGTEAINDGSMVWYRKK